jgi:hypothetical protein
LITCRRPLAALANDSAYTVPLGPLPPSEAALYLKAQPALSRMIFGNNADEQTLAMRALNASRFHPLLMDRLARLAADITLRPQLLQALDTLEKSQDFAQLPALFAARSGDSTELAYLNDALATSLDQLIRDAGPDARRLLWMITVANEPVALGLLKAVWSEESLQRQMYRRMKHDLERLHELPPDHQAYLNNLPPEILEKLDALPPEPPAWPEITPLLHQLVSVGLVTEEPATPDHANPDLSCHELVRERIRARMAQQPQDQGDLTENAIRLSYAEWLEAFFNALQHQDMSLALQAGSRALVYCVQAEAWDRLGRFAGSVVTSTKDPRLLDGLIPHLQAAAETAPEGKARWLCLCFLADAISMSGRPDISLPIYEQAATLARANAEAGSDDALQAWSVLATITGNWAVALAKTGKLDAARDRHLESADASRRAAAPAIHVIGCELEALRINIMQDKTDTALPEVEWRLAQVQLWWMQHGAGQVVPEAPDAEFLARVFIGALDIARSADFARQNWASALQRIETELDVKRALQRSAEDIGETRMNRANVLVEIPGRLGEAKAELEACLELFRNKPDWISKVRGSLANLFDEQGDIAQAIIQQRRALALLEQLPNPTDRAISHNNLANYLNKSCSTGDLIESSYHRLAALLYLVVMQYAQHLQTLLRSYAITFRRAHAAGTEFSPPRVADLLANPAFAPLDQWLQQHQIDLDELQASVDQFLDQARQLALSAENSP